MAAGRRERRLDAVAARDEGAQRANGLMVLEIDAIVCTVICVL